MTTIAFIGTDIPKWAEDVAQRVLDEGHAVTTTLHTAQRHERVLFRLADGTVYIANRGRGMTTLTPDEACQMARFLMGWDHAEPAPVPTGTTCLHCGRGITQDPDGTWVDPEAPATPEDGDDHLWRATCDSSTSFAAEHEPA